jgi:uncharacterized protein YbjT (DUF2867 family)
MTTNSSTLVIGATGNVGGALVGQLAAAGEPVHALVRRETALPEGVSGVVGDLTDPASLDDALVGVDRVFLVWPLGGPVGADAVVTRLASSARRIVYLSSHGASEAPDADPITRMHGTLERLVRGSGVEWTFLRSGGMAANTLGWADQIRTRRTVQWPYGAAGRSLVHEADLAAVAHTALTGDALVEQAPHLTGPETLTQVQQVETIGAALGERVRWEELSRDQAREQMLGWGWAADTVDGALDAWAGMVVSPEVVSPDVERILGRPPAAYSQWVRDHLDAFR